MRVSDTFRWRGIAVVRKYEGCTLPDVLAGRVQPYAVVRTGPNEVMFGGASAMWECLMGRWSESFWTAGSAACGVGNSGISEDQTQTDLQGSSKRKGMDMTPDHIPYPIHTDGFTADALSIVFSSTFDVDEANFHWREWGVFNQIAGGRMLNRKAEDIGMKLAGQIWQLEPTLILEC